MNGGEGRRVVIFGGSEPAEGDSIFQDAEGLGRALAEAGWTVVNGGYGGTMLASARGARAASGRVIGVTCSIFRSAPNPFITEEVRTADLHERLRRLIELGDAYIALPGSTGTLAELALVWEVVNKRLIPRRPILCWGDFWRPVVTVFEADETNDARLDTRGLPKRRGELVTFVQTAAQALAALAQ